MLRPLDDICILDLTQGLCGPFCTQILRDLGARVIKIEPPSGDMSRRMGTRHRDSSIPYISVNRGKESVVLDLYQEEERESFLRLVQKADVVAEDLGPGRSDRLGIGYEAAKARKPDIIYLSITGYGHQGMYRDYSSQDAIVQAVSGFMSITGEAGGEYTRAGVPLADGFTGIYGAIGVLAGLIRRGRKGESLYIDLAKLDVMFSAMPDTFSKYLNTGQTTRPKGCRHQLVGFFGPVKTRDGAVICMASQDHQFRAMTEILGLEGLDQDERFHTMTKRCVNGVELEEIVNSRAREMTMDELTKKLLERKIPVGPMNTLEKILDSHYTAYHQLVMEVRDCREGSFRVVGSPMRFQQFAMARTDFADPLGEHTREVLQGIPVIHPRESAEEGMLHRELRGSGWKRGEEALNERPLSGVRILDLTRFMAGPLGIQILEHLGAEIIKVERRGQLSEFSRSTEPVFGNTSAYFLAINNGKKDIMLDLNQEEHREIFLKLAEKCDVVADNFRPGVTEKLGIAYEDVRKRKADIIYSTVSGFGYTGPYRTQGCVDTVCQAMSGLMSLTGQADGEPVRGGSSVADVCASLYEAVAILASILYHHRTGEGGFVDSPMLSAMLSISDGISAEYLNHGTIFRRTGNRDRSRAFFQTVPTQDGSVMVEAAEEEHFSAFVTLLGLPWLLEEEAFKTSSKRLKHIGELEDAIFPITRGMTMTQLADACRKAGIPAGEVNTLERISRSGYLEERQLICQVHDSREGDFKVIGLPMKFDQFRIPKETFAAQPGEHTKEVLKHLLGMEDAV